jgi:hypothetical protein
MADVSIDDNGCWLWTKSVTKRGYPQMSFNGKKVYPHRWLYEVTVAPFAEGMQAAHKCDVKRCVNPDHIEPATAQKNSQDALDRGLYTQWQVAKTHCKWGHLLPEPAANGRRQCRECARIYRARPDQRAKNADRSLRYWRRKHGRPE